MLFCRLLIFFRINFSKKKIRIIIRVKQFVSRLDVGPDLGLNCLQRLSAEDTSRYRDKSFFSGDFWSLPITFANSLGLD